ncbi:molybdopterin-dependent oxidoreductase [Methylomonas sp. AM2-LC]|uniref:molybdopterin-dependent oxidoreductase n=1 Tax=Methylomonas sp. AM2-LC TaxID=3153301 RepID=UPI003262CE65
MATLVKTTCPYCGVGCGIDAEVNTDLRQVIIQGDKSHPANFGRLCSKGSALADTVILDGRLLQPKIAGQDSHWPTALDLVASTFRDIIDTHGPDAVAIYGSGQLLTEDYYVANKLMKGFIGSGNMDTNSRLCMSSSVAGHKRAFGADTVPGCYADFESANLILLIGSNAAWCHPVSFQRIKAAKAANPALKVVVIDPRRTNSCDIADLHLPLAIGSDTTLFNGLLQYLAAHNALDQPYIETHTEGFSAALSQATLTLKKIASVCRLPKADIDLFYRWFSETEKVMSLYSQGVNQSSSGTDKVNSIINCHLATGRIGKPGMGPFSLTGQPNAMGGREVGGLSHQLAAHMDFSNAADIERVARFWGTDNIAQKPGYAAVELFDAIHDGKVKAVWIMGTNPVVSMPNADKVKQALAKCPFVVVSDCIEKTDTTAYAHVLLPAVGWSEKDGTVTNSERRISRQRALFPAAGEAKPDWWIISEVAKRLGFAKAFSYQSAADIFREHAALSGFENNQQHGERDFDISAYADITPVSYEQLQPTQWPVNQHYPEGRARLFADGQYFTASGKAQFIAITPRLPVNQPNKHYPLILNTGRLRDQWHTMTRTALSAKLNQHKPEPCVEIHPLDAQQYGLIANSLAKIETAWGSMLARVTITDQQQSGQLFVPMHWTAQYASQGRMGSLVNPVVDPISKQAESKHTPVRISPYTPDWYAFILSRHALKLDNIEYWIKNKADHYYRYELASAALSQSWPDWISQHLPNSHQTANDVMEYADSGLQQYRAAYLHENELDTVIFIDGTNTLPERAWLGSLFAKNQLDTSERSALLSGKPPQGKPDCGAIICACFNVGETTIRNAIASQSLKTVQEVGRCLKAGTNCGSCLPEIKALF